MKEDLALASFCLNLDDRRRTGCGAPVFRRGRFDESVKEDQRTLIKPGSNLEKNLKYLDKKFCFRVTSRPAKTVSLRPSCAEGHPAA